VPKDVVGKKVTIQGGFDLGPIETISKPVETDLKP
jgi:hypothetical protein